jgi:triphosphoribosyl-dephospho-CoA synthetase
VVGESVPAGVSAIPSAVPSTLSVAEAAPKAGAPAWCRTIDSPTVTALADVLPQLVTDEAAAAAPKVHAAATVLRNAAASAAAESGRLLTAADSLDAAADAKSATSLQVVGTAFTSLSKGVQSKCGFH